MSRTWCVETTTVRRSSAYPASNLRSTRFEGNVQAVGRFVQQQHRRIAGQCERELHPLALAHRKAVEPQVALQRKLLQVLLELPERKVGIERRVHLPVTPQGNRGQGKFLRDKEQFTVKCRFPARGVESPDPHRSLGREQQSRCKFKQRRFAGAVHTEQPVYMPGQKGQRQAVEQLVRTPVTKNNLFQSNHSL